MLFFILEDFAPHRICIRRYYRHIKPSVYTSLTMQFVSFCNISTANKCRVFISHFPTLCMERCLPFPLFIFSIFIFFPFLYASCLVKVNVVSSFFFFFHFLLSDLFPLLFRFTVIYPLLFTFTLSLSVIFSLFLLSSTSFFPAPLSSFPFLLSLSLLPSLSPSPSLAPFSPSSSPLFSLFFLFC